MSYLLPFLLAVSAPQASDHSSLHPKEAALYVQAMDVPALTSAYLASGWGDMKSDEELQKGLAKMLEVEALDLARVLEFVKAEFQLDIDAKLVRHLSELRAMSASLCMLEGDPVVAFHLDRMFSQDTPKVLKAQLIADFSSAEAATSALADVLEAAGLKEAPFCTIEGARLVLGFGELSTSDEPGPSLTDRWGSLGTELGDPQGTTLLQAYSTMDDRYVQWAEGIMGYTGVDGPLGQVMSAVIGAPFVAMTRGGAWRVCAREGEFYTSGRYPHRSESVVDEVFGSKKLTGEDLAFLHPDARVAGAISVDHETLVPWARSLLALTGQMEDAKEFEQLYGFDPIRDLVEPLGASIHWSIQGNLSLGTPPSQLSARITDEPAMIRGIQGLAKWVEAMLSGTVEVKTKTYKKVELITFQYIGEIPESVTSVVDPSALIRPTLAVFDGRVILTPNRALAQREIKRVRKAEEGQGILPMALARNPSTSMPVPSWSATGCTWRAGW